MWKDTVMPLLHSNLEYSCTDLTTMNNSRTNSQQPSRVSNKVPAAYKSVASLLDEYASGISGMTDCANGTLRKVHSTNILLRNIPDIRLWQRSYVTLGGPTHCREPTSCTRTIGLAAITVPFLSCTVTNVSFIMVLRQNKVSETSKILRITKYIRIYSCHREAQR